MSAVVRRWPPAFSMIRAIGRWWLLCHCELGFRAGVPGDGVSGRAPDGCGGSPGGLGCAAVASMARVAAWF